MALTIHIDGAARGNPGPASIGATLKDGSGNLIASISQPIGRATNNQAEYRAIIAALEKAVSLSASQAEIYLDSLLVVKQINGQYRVKNKTLQPLYRKVKELQNQLISFKIGHIIRQKNKEADRLVNKAINLGGLL